jgi:nucleoid DNA-binding protein
MAKKSTAKKIVKKEPIKKITKINKPYTKSELYSVLSGRTQLARHQIACVFDELSTVVSAHLKKDGPEKFILPGLLKIVIKKVPAKPAREGKNPFTGEMMMFKAKPASKKVKVIAMKQLKDLVS